jgi:hypothetical protein
MTTINICNYFDVWGNQKDGYEVNSWNYPVKNLGAEIDSEKDILNLLKEQGLLNEKCRINQVTIEDESNGLIMIYERKTRKPMFCIEYGS